VSGLEDGQLPLVLLLPAFEVQSQNRLIHHAGEQEDPVDLLLLGHPAELVLEGHGDFGSEEALLLVGSSCQRETVSKSVPFVKRRYIDCVI